MIAALLLAGCDDGDEAAETGSGDETVAPAPDPDAGATVEIAPGRYASDAMVLVLNSNGTFSLIEHGQSAGADGAYSISGAVVTFSDATGEAGDASFPMDCPVSQTETGFQFAAGTDGCALAGQSFGPTAG
jgi:hypothetical protein